MGLMEVLFPGFLLQLQSPLTLHYYCDWCGAEHDAVIRLSQMYMCD